MRELDYEYRCKTFRLYILNKKFSYRDSPGSSFSGAGRKFGLLFSDEQEQRVRLSQATVKKAYLDQKFKIMRKISFLVLCLFFGSLAFGQSEKTEVNELLETWHKAAAEANYNNYFSLMADESVFIGTDATENWNKQEFMEWSKQYFDRGKAWSFSTLERNIYLGEDAEFAWFDELLDTQMGICRGSGVVVKEDGEWKVIHYVLSIAIPNENVGEVTALKAKFDEKLMAHLRSE